MTFRRHCARCSRAKPPSRSSSSRASSVAKDPRHRIARRLWVVLYVFVAIQLAWVLRPFVGSPNLDVHFFREGAWSNAYVVLFSDVLRFDY